MRIASTCWLTPRRLIPLVLSTGFFVLLDVGTLAQQLAVDASPPPFFVPRDPSPGQVVPGPALLGRLVKSLGALDRLSDERCLQLYREILAHPPTEETVQALNSILEKLARPSRHVPLSKLMSISGRTFVWNEWDDVASFASEWVKTKPEETARWLADQGTRYLPARKVSESISYAIYQWGNENPRAASEFAVALPPDADSHSPMYWYLHKVAYRRSAEDLADTLAWAEALPDTDRRRTAALLGVLDRLVETDLPQAKRFVQQQLSTNKDASELAVQLVNDVASPREVDVQMDDLGQWVLSLSDPPVRRAALDCLTSVWLTKMDRLWTKFDDVPKVVTWAAALPPGDVHGEVMQTVIAAWGPLRPIKAKEWLHNLPEGPDRNAAMAAYDEAIIGEARKKFSSRQPSRAFYWLQTNLLDQKRAAELVGTMLFEWTRKDPAHAREWADGHGISLPSDARAKGER